MAKEVKKEEPAAAPNQELALVVQQSTELATECVSWGAAESVEASDLKLPRIQLTQGLSKVVSDGAASVGQFRDSSTNELLGDKNKPLELIIFSAFKTVKTDSKDPRGPSDQKAKYVKTEHWTPAHRDQPREEMGAAGMLYINTLVWNYFALRPGEEVATSLPYVISFSRMGMNAAQLINLLFKRLEIKNLPSAAVVVALTPRKQSNEKGDFFVADVSVARDSSKVELAAARHWYDVIQKSATKVVVEEDEDVPAAPLAARQSEPIVVNELEDAPVF